MEQKCKQKVMAAEEEKEEDGMAERA